VPEPGARPARLQDSQAAAFAALLALCALLYGMTLAAPVFYDDLSHVQNGPLLAASWREAWAAAWSRRYFALAAERTWQPLVTLLHRALGPTPWLYRGAGIVLHALNGLLVFRLGRRLSGAGPAWAAALLFCAFPPSTEAVFFSSFKGHLLACGFGLAALERWLAYLDDADRRALGAALAAYAGALLSKETGLAAGVLCGLAWLCLGRPRRTEGLAAVGALSAAYLAARFLWLLPPPPFPERFARPFAASLAWYLRSLVWPAPLCLEHTLSGVGAAGAAAFAGLAALLWACRARPKRLFLALWIPAALLPFLHLIAFANLSPVADRYLYLPAAGFCLLLADAFSGGRARLAPAALLAAWGGATAARNGLFRDERGLFEQTAACAPANARAQYLLGLACLKDEDPAAAETAFRRALALRDSPGIRARLAETLRLEGRDAEARALEGAAGRERR
jgi:hypothetical protein